MSDRRYGVTFTRWQQWRIKRLRYGKGGDLAAQRYILRILDRTRR